MPAVSEMLRIAEQRMHTVRTTGGLWQGAAGYTWAQAHLAGVSRGEKENAGIGRRMNGIALVFRIYHAFGQSMAGRA
jgi:hypothetical protein